MMAGENSDLSILQKNFQAWLDAYNARDLDEYFSHYHEDVLLFGYGPEPFNKANVRSWYENMYDHFDMSSVLEDVMWAGDRNAFRWRMRARQRKEFMGIEPSGKWVEAVGLSTTHWKDGKIIERWSCFDMLAFSEALKA